MILSILIPVHTAHVKFLKPLLQHLNEQVEKEEVEHIVEIRYLIDGGEITTGKKRNELLALATGEWVVFIDADDWVADYYIRDMLAALETNPDCVAINGVYTKNGIGDIQWFLAKDNPNRTITIADRSVFLRRSNHITAIRRSIALKIGFNDVSNAEDKYYSDGINQYLKTEAVITRPMYYYRFTTANKLYT